MFKGQGANTALADGVTLARWLQQRPLRPALACFEREMIARSGPRVAASREAAIALHSPAVLQTSTPHPFNGVRDHLHGPLRGALREANIGAALVANGEDSSLDKLEGAVTAVLMKLSGLQRGAATPEEESEQEDQPTAAKAQRVDGDCTVRSQASGE
jgi:hypothetical protein